MELIPWFENAKLMLSLKKEPRDYVETLWLVSPWIDEWITRNLVRGNDDREKIVRDCKEWYDEMADFSKIQPPYGGLEKICKTYKRLQGLCK